MLRKRGLGLPSMEGEAKAALHGKLETKAILWEESHLQSDVVVFQGHLLQMSKETSPILKCQDPIGKL